MFKRAAMKATLVHLLVVLSLVIESNQCPIGAVSRQKKWLVGKLTAGDLDAKDTLGYLIQVRSKSKLTIGGTNVEQLLELKKIESANCKDGSIAKRQEICEQAKSEGLTSIEYYCKFYLTDLIEFCKGEATMKMVMDLTREPSEIGGLRAAK